MKTIKPLMFGLAVLALAAWYVAAAPKVLAVSNETGPTTGFLNVIKNVINDNGHDKIAGDFSLSVTDGSSVVQNFMGNASGTSLTVATGTYSVTETSDADYTTNYSSDCTGTIAAGETKTCTVMNDDVVPIYVATTGTLMVIKTVVNDDDGGDWQPGDFVMVVDYANGEGTSTQSFSGDSAGTAVTLQAGRYYTVSEGENSYAATYSADCSGQLAVGQTKTCTVINDDILSESVGKVTIVKHVVNRYDGTSKASDFNLSLDYQAPFLKEKVRLSTFSPATTTATFPGNENGTSYIVRPGYYQVTEPEHAGYNVSYSEGCRGTINGGSRITCTVTNTDIEVSRGGAGWSPGILEPFYITNPEAFGNSGSGSTGGSTGNEGSGNNSQDQDTGGSASTTGRVLGVTSPIETIVPPACTVTEDDARYITSDTSVILGHLGREKDPGFEERMNARLTSRVADDSVDPAILGTIRNFVTYGTRSTQRLGAGERAGVVASFHAAYGRLPSDICDWQEALRLANTKQPKRLASRDLQSANSFEAVYGRGLREGNLTDMIAQSLMGYGIRPQKRDLDAERKALVAFSRTFGRFPTDTDEWDVNRAMAYSGLAQRWLPASLALASSRVLSIEGLGAYFALGR